jgi:hypothetical protein
MGKLFTEEPLEPFFMMEKCNNAKSGEYHNTENYPKIKWFSHNGRVFRVYPEDTRDKHRRKSRERHEGEPFHDISGFGCK